VFTSSTTVNVEKDTSASEIIYTAETDDKTMLLIFIEVTVPMITTVPLKVAVAISLALIFLSSPILFQTTEVDKLDSSTDTVISNNLTKINSDNTWSLDNDDTWTSKLTQSDYTVTVYLSGDGGNGGNVR
jgi:hypothetical protein